MLITPVNWDRLRCHIILSYYLSLAQSLDFFFFFFWDLSRFVVVGIVHVCDHQYKKRPGRHAVCVGLMLGQRLRRWPNIKTTLGQSLLFAGGHTSCQYSTAKWENITFFP